MKKQRSKHLEKWPYSIWENHLIWIMLLNRDLNCNIKIFDVYAIKTIQMRPPSKKEREPRKQRQKHKQDELIATTRTHITILKTNSVTQPRSIWQNDTNFNTDLILGNDKKKIKKEIKKKELNDWYQLVNTHTPTIKTTYEKRK